MKIADKELSEYFSVIKLPLAVLVLFYIASTIYASVDYASYVSVFGGLTAFLVYLFVFGYLGWSSVTDYKLSVRHSAWAGAVMGFLAGLASASAMLVMVHFIPEVAEYAVDQAVAQGAPAASLEMVKNMLYIGAYFSLFLGPLFIGAIGALLSGLSAWATSRFKSGKR